ncbi:MAG: hypothetical protein ISR65_16605 [Bacteriovoracaceae bacterium]|nr:hypothetical protein [Bacteriovoracaceae bacterium]
MDVVVKRDVEDYIDIFGRVGLILKDKFQVQFEQKGLTRNHDFVELELG